MQIQKKKPTGDPKVERQIVTGMITSTEFLHAVAPIYRGHSLTLPYARKVAEWCIDFYREYGEAPFSHITDLYHNYRERGTSDDLNEEQQGLLEDFLVSLSEDWEEDDNFNVQYVARKAEAHFREQHLSNIIEQTKGLLVSGRLEEAESSITNFNRIVRPQTSGVDPIRDRDAIVRTFDSGGSTETLFQFRGDLGRLIGPFERGMFFMVVAPMGRGKTWFLLHTALVAMREGLNVLFISLEMTERQIMRRIHYTLTGRPRWDATLHIPIFDCRRNQTGECDRVRTDPLSQEVPLHKQRGKQHRVCDQCRGDSRFLPSVWWVEREVAGLDTDGALKKADALAKSYLRGAATKILIFPPSDKSVSDLNAVLDNWEYYDGWMPDVIVTDYADKFAPEDRSVREYRHRIHQTVEAHKALALKRNVLVVSASQSTTGRDDRKDVKSGDFAEDIRKKAEIDGAWALNQTPEEGEQGVMRVSMMKLRDDKFSTLRSCMILQCLDIGKVCIDSQIM